MNDTEGNRYIYVKKNYGSHETPTILINPHFRRTVYINPQFNHIYHQNVKPKEVHVNPKVFPDNVLKYNDDLNSNETDVLKNKVETLELPTCSSAVINSTATSTVTTIVHNKFKIIKSANKKEDVMHMLENISPIKFSNHSNAFKLDRRKNHVSTAIAINNKKRFVCPIVANIKPIIKKSCSKNTKFSCQFINISGTLYESRKHSLRKRLPSNKTIHAANGIRSLSRSKYSTPTRLSFSNKSKSFKLDRRRKSISTPIINKKKKFVFTHSTRVKRFVKNSCSKNNRFKTQYINVSGIVYETSKHSLKRKLLFNSSGINYQKKQAPLKNPEKRKYGINKRILTTKESHLNKSNYHVSKGAVLKKCNIPCPLYRKYGRCMRQEMGACNYYHNPNHVTLCSKFLRGVCLKNDCPLSHKISAGKMPTCKYYLNNGMCTKDNCPYTHVKINTNAEICKEFLKGFCEDGAQCNKRHQFLCPDFEKMGSCSRSKCPYPHEHRYEECKTQPVKIQIGNNNETQNNNKIDVLSTRRDSPQQEIGSTVRYYNKNENGEVNNENKSDSNVAQSILTRPKLGILPNFIPFHHSQ